VAGRAGAGAEAGAARERRFFGRAIDQPA
jgi:hypothetical protein